MKLFKKLMAGVMAIAMLSAYTVAFAGSTTSGITSGGTSSVEFQGSIAGGGGSVFLMKLPTAAANSALSFTVDPKEIIKNSPPSNAITTGSGASTYGTVIFSIESGSQVTYTNKSEPLKVVSMSSMDVTVNMIATLSDTKMTLSTTSGFSTAKEHLYLGVQVETISAVSGSAAAATPVASGGAKYVDGLGATNAAVLKTVSSNFKSIVSGGTTTTVVSGATTSAGNLDAAGRIPEKNWNAVQYTVIGYSNPAADWEIDGIAAPTLTIKWVIDPSDKVTYAMGTQANSSQLPANSTYTAKLDKEKYKAGETVTVYVKPTSSETKLSSVTFNYIGLGTDGTMKTESNVKATVKATPVNGVYSATFTLPNNMARPTSPKGDIAAYVAPTWEIDVS